MVLRLGDLADGTHRLAFSGDQPCRMAGPCLGGLLLSASNFQPLFLSWVLPSERFLIVHFQSHSGGETLPWGQYSFQNTLQAGTDLEA